MQHPHAGTSRIGILAKKCEERDYDFLEWMLCYLFRGSLGLTEKEDVELRVAEAEKGVDLTIEDIIRVLGGDGKMRRWVSR